MVKTAYTYDAKTGEFFDTTPSGYGSEYCTANGTYTIFHKPREQVIASGYAPCQDAIYTPPTSPSHTQSFSEGNSSFTVHHHAVDEATASELTVVLEACNQPAPEEPEKRVKSFLPIPDLCDDYGQEYFYFGWETVNGSWMIRRQLRATSKELSATQSGNSAYSELVTAWDDRENLNYS